MTPPLFIDLFIMLVHVFLFCFYGLTHLWPCLLISLSRRLNSDNKRNLNLLLVHVARLGLWVNHSKSSLTPCLFIGTQLDSQLMRTTLSQRWVDSIVHTLSQGGGNYHASLSRWGADCQCRAPGLHNSRDNTSMCWTCGLFSSPCITFSQF